MLVDCRIFVFSNTLKKMHSPHAQPADVPSQLEVPSVNNDPFTELSQVPVRPRRERREPLWFQDNVRTVVVYPALPFTLLETVAI